MDESPAQKRILIIDDEPDLIEVLSGKLTAMGFEVEGMLDAVEGRRAAMKRAPDLIVLDINIPGWNGLELIESLRHVPSLRAVPILIYTARRDSNDEKIAKSRGATDIFLKGLQDQALVSKIKELLI